jgi:Tfp pilus assembly protein PilF
VSNTLSAAQAQEIQQLLGSGFAALGRGDFASAGDCCAKALALKPDLVQGHFLVALVALESNQRRTAFSAFQSVVKLDRDHAAAWAHLAKLYMSEGQVNRADEALRETQRLKPDDPLVLDLIGTTLSQMGEHGAAQVFFGRANTKKPQFPPFMQNLANNLVYHGDTEQAERIFHDIVAVQQDSPQAHWSLASSRRAEDAAHIEQMKALAQRHDDNPRAQAFYFYAIGKEYEDLQQWPEAIAAFHRGAAARRASVEYDEANEIEFFDYLQQHFDADWLTACGAGSTDPSPIFILGQPRTGTTLIERIVTSHSQAHSAGELQQLSLALRRLSNYQDPRRFSADLFAAARNLNPQRIAEVYLRTTARMRGESPRFVDKLPQNYLLVPFILAAFPRAKIVHLVRDPMDACLASYKQLFADAYLHSYHQEEMARHHLRYRELMHCWHSRFPGRIFDISYEATAADVEPQARALLDYLELPWEEACLNFHQQDGAVSTASAVQVREPAHTRSIGRWRRYASELRPMQACLEAGGINVK